MFFLFPYHVPDHLAQAIKRWSLRPLPLPSYRLFLLFRSSPSLPIPHHLSVSHHLSPLARIQSKRARFTATLDLPFLFLPVSLLAPVIPTCSRSSLAVVPRFFVASHGSRKVAEITEYSSGGIKLTVRLDASVVNRYCFLFR